MKLIRKILVKMLGLRGYLRLVSGTYIKMVSMGMMKNKYPELFFIKKAVKPGDVVIDIGANLAYYSTVMAKTAGLEGQVYAVEPIPLFAEVWTKNMRSSKKYNVVLFNCALGSEPEEKVKMSIPIKDGVVRHGLTKVVEEGDENEAVMSYDVPMKVGDELFQDKPLQKLDYVKCDVEGYEQYVIPSFEKIISSFKPMFQIELGGTENRSNVADFLMNKGYEVYILKDHILNSISKEQMFEVNQDFYFIHADDKANRKSLIKS
ncbi:MAG: FkbM family methyltransferase [Arenicella sp.]|jgi:FkbM family methyltransferase